MNKVKWEKWYLKLFGILDCVRLDLDASQMFLVMTTPIFPQCRVRYPDQHPSESPSIRLEIRTKAWKQEPQESPGESDVRGASCSGHRKHIETPSISIEIGISRDFTRQSHGKVMG